MKGVRLALAGWEQGIHGVSSCGLTCVRGTRTYGPGSRSARLLAPRSGCGPLEREPEVRADCGSVRHRGHEAEELPSPHPLMPGCVAAPPVRRMGPGRCRSLQTAIAVPTALEMHERTGGTLCSWMPERGHARPTAAHSNGTRRAADGPAARRTAALSRCRSGHDRCPLGGADNRSGRCLDHPGGNRLPRRLGLLASLSVTPTQSKPVSRSLGRL